MTNISAILQTKVPSIADYVQ